MKNAYYFSHDTNSRNDPKIMAMMNVYGAEGYGWFWIIVETLSEQGDYKLKHCDWVTNALAMAMLCDTNTVVKFIQDCIDSFELFKTDGEYFWSNSLKRRMELKEEKRRKKSEAGKKGAENRWKNGGAITEPKQCYSDDIAKHGKVKESKVKESKKYIGEFEQLWKLYPKKKGKSDAEKKYPKIRERYSYQQLEAAIKKYAAEVKGKEEQYILHGSTFFNGRYKDYIQDNETPKVLKLTPRLIEI